MVRNRTDEIKKHPNKYIIDENGIESSESGLSNSLACNRMQQKNCFEDRF